MKPGDIKRNWEDGKKIYFLLSSAHNLFAMCVSGGREEEEPPPHHQKKKIEEEK